MAQVKEVLLAGEGKYHPYPEYKDSGGEWLGLVPSSWKVKRLKYLASLVTDKAVSRNYPVGLENIEGWTGRFVPTNSEFQGEGISFQEEDILFGKLRPYLAKVLLAEQPGEAVGDFHVLRPTSGACSRYLQYQMLTKEFISIVDGSTFGAKMPRVSWEFMANLLCAQPSESEAGTIAAFLDYETARIDSLIDKQQRLIELLKEKRQAVISHAVTKGLNPDAPMKDSGVEWLGQVPEHWVVSPLKYHCSFSGGGTPSKENTSYWNGSIPWVSPKDMKSYWITDSEDKITEQAVVESSTNLIAAGAVLIVVRSGILQRTIPVGINTIPVTINQDMKAIRFKSIAYAQYISMFIKGYEQSLLLDWRKQGATVESLEHEYLANTLIPFPPEEEVLEIIRNLTQKLQKFDQIECDTTKAISLLQERRTALISAAVTGKIDLRGWTQPVKEDAA